MLLIKLTAILLVRKTPMETQSINFYNTFSGLLVIQGVHEVSLQLMPYYLM